MDLCRQSNVSVFNTLSRFVIAFLSRCKRLYDWENAIALDTMQGYRASSRREGKISWVFILVIVDPGKVHCMY